MITPPTYPARPVNGGPFDKSPPKHGKWFYEPKYNGWRALVHAPSGAMFNRHNERLTIEDEFTSPIGLLMECASALFGFPEWFDCEALERRHTIGQGTLIILDILAPRKLYEQRREMLEELGLPVASLNPRLMPANSLLIVPNDLTPTDAWEELQGYNSAVDCEFYEGFVAKKSGSIYPQQLRNPRQEFPGWIKHRWAF